jgi:reverse transcriptase-like protein
MTTAASAPMDRWETLPWKHLQRHVCKLQKRIYRASCRDEVRIVRKLQRLLVQSRAARLLAVRRVAQENQGQRSAGVDGVQALTPSQCLALALPKKSVLRPIYCRFIALNLAVLLSILTFWAKPIRGEEKRMSPHPAEAPRGSMTELRAALDAIPADEPRNYLRQSLQLLLPLLEQMHHHLQAQEARLEALESDDR